MGTQCLPEGFTPHQVGDDFVLGVRKDDLGVERVVLYGLDRGASSGGLRAGADRYGVRKP